MRNRWNITDHPEEIVMIKCEICGKECKDINGLSTHLRQVKDHMTVKEYYSKFDISKYLYEKLDKMFINRFIIDSNSGCWLWNDQKDKDGYGILYAYKVTIKAHQFSYKKFKGDIPKGIYVCHTCDTPSCVNPEHLWLGTNIDNTKDSVEKGRRAFGNKNSMSKVENRKKVSEALKGKPRNISDKQRKLQSQRAKELFLKNNPMKNPDIAKKCQESRKRNRLKKGGLILW